MPMDSGKKDMAGLFFFEVVMNFSPKARER